MNTGFIEPNLNPSTSVCYPVQLGIIRRQIGQVDQAVESFTQALDLNEESGFALQGAGEAYLAQVRC